MKALWAAGTKAYDGARVSLPETTCYPRPVGDIPVIVGGTGQRTLRIAATLGDAANVPSARPQLDEHVATLRRHSDTVRITVLDLPTIGTDREDAWARVERLRGRTAAAAYAERTHAGTAADQRDRWGGLAELGVDTVFLGDRRPRGCRDVERTRAPLATCGDYLSSVLDSPRTRRATISCWICWVPSKMSRILESRAHFSSSSVSL